MKRAFVIGHPISHSRSPVIHGYWLRQFGIAGSYEPIHVEPADLAAFLDGFADKGFVGGNVTIPHKEGTFARVARTTERAARLGAVNTLTLLPDGRLHGDNTDGDGFLASVDEAVGAGWERGAGPALILGAGGAARAIVDALLGRGLPRIRIVNRNRERAEGLAAFDPDRVEIVDVAGPDAMAETGLLVNTTALGMAGQPPLEIDLSRLPAHAIVVDIVYVPLETPLLAAARARGLRGVDGLGMLLHQAKPGFEAWFGVRPSVTPELRAVVEADLAARP